MAHAERRFEKIFREYLDDIERRALRVGINLTAVSRSVKISRSTPDRWRRAVPRTIKILDEMDQCVIDAEKKHQRTTTAAASNS